MKIRILKRNEIYRVQWSAWFKPWWTDTQFICPQLGGGCEQVYGSLEAARQEAVNFTYARATKRQTNRWITWDKYSV